MSNVKISQKAKVKVTWEDLPINYNKQTIKEIQYFVSKKYNINRNNVKVGFAPIQIDETGKKIHIQKATITNILDDKYQQDLFKEWLKQKGIKIPFADIIDLDNKVNAATVLTTVKHNVIWDLKWLELDNFLSFGDKTRIDFNSLNDIIMVTSIPENQGGKTNLTIDAIKFAFFGNTTKTDKNEEVFNAFSNKDKVVVSACINIEGLDYIIKRILTRKQKSNGDWVVSGKVEYSSVNPDGSKENLTGDESNDIKSNIGLESDFDLIISATGKNLDKIVDTKPTERGKIFNKLIGIEPIMLKLDIVRKMYNTFNKSMLANHFNITELTENNNDSALFITESETALTTRKAKEVSLEVDKSTLQNKIDDFYNRKITIDENLTDLDIDVVNRDIESYIQEGIQEKGKQDGIITEIAKLITYDYSEDEDALLTNTNNQLFRELTETNSRISQLNTTVTTLQNSQKCSLCGQSLEDIDNSGEIKTAKEQLKMENEGLLQLMTAKDINDDSLEVLNGVKTKVSRRNRLEIERDRIGVVLSELRNIVREKRQIKSEYELNGTTIILNQELDDNIIATKADIKVIEVEARENIQKIAQLEANIKEYLRNIKDNDERIKRLVKETKEEQVYKIYIEMMGKKGISKLVLASVLPIINSELYRILDDITDFDVEIDINDKQDVEFYIIKGDSRKLLKSGSGFEITTSSLAIRAILGRLSHLPKPNFLILDEVFGKIANINLPKIEPLFGRLLDWYDKIFIITHNELIKDWSKHIILIEKTNDISQASVK